MKTWLFKYWKVLLAMSGIFLAGAVVGCVATSVIAASIVKHRLNPTNWSHNAMERLDRNLDLSDEQRRELEPIVEESIGNIKQIIRQAGAAWVRNFYATKDRVMPYLNEQQRAKVDKLSKERIAKLQQLLKLERGNVEPPPPPPAPEEPPLIHPPPKEAETKE